ncbi:hypothetical protein ZIOFF_056939 [Zingiber officinale]|uniref:Uncharacterized protein n=1 Tax=Zingiber officinale TaxID=94328 RepID=A0A8J5KSZ5_ZINOF|nr:hypothetical protein ZIOFF_056939 [Zingiber officinale]
MKASSYLHIDHHVQLRPRAALDLLGATGRDDGHARRQAHDPAGVAAGLPRRLHHGHRAAIRPRDRAPRASHDGERDRHHAPVEDRAGVLLQRGADDDAVAGDVTVVGFTGAGILPELGASVGGEPSDARRRARGVAVGEGEGEVDGGARGAVEVEVQEDGEGEVEGGARGAVEALYCRMIGTLEKGLSPHSEKDARIHRATLEMWVIIGIQVSHCSSIPLGYQRKAIAAMHAIAAVSTCGNHSVQNG